MKSTLRRARTTTIFMGVASLVCGLVVLLNPTSVALFLTSLIGGVTAVAGIVTLLGYLRDRALGSQLDLLVGLVELVFGAILWIWPALFVNWIVVVAGVLILFSGIGDLVDARALAAAGLPRGGLATALAVLTIAFGLLVVASPFALVDVMFAVAGAGLVFNGVTELVAAFVA